MDRRGPHEGKPQRHIHRLLPPEQFQRDQGLVMVKGHHGVVFPPDRGSHQGVHGERTLDRPAKRAKGRPQDPLLLPTEESPFTGVRIQSGQPDPGTPDSEIGPHRLFHHPDRPDNLRPGQPEGDLFYGQMRSHQTDPEEPRDEHHDRRATEGGPQKLGVPHPGEPGPEDRFLGNRSGDQGIGPAHPQETDRLLQDLKGGPPRGGLDSSNAKPRGDVGEIDPPEATPGKRESKTASEKLQVGQIAEDGDTRLLRRSAFGGAPRNDSEGL